MWGSTLGLQDHACPGPKAGAKPLGHPGIPKMKDLSQGVRAEECETPQRKGQTDVGKSSLFIHTAHRLGFRDEAEVGAEYDAWRSSSRQLHTVALWGAMSLCTLTRFSLHSSRSGLTQRGDRGHQKAAPGEGGRPGFRVRGAWASAPQGLAHVPGMKGWTWSTWLHGEATVTADTYDLEKL